MATTTNYGWTTPDDTALVKDGAAAIRTLGSSVDTTTKALNPSTTLGDIEYRSSTANTNTRVGIGSSGEALTVVAGVPSWAASATSTLTTTGDILYASAANTLARRAIGSTGNVLTVAGGVPTWAAPAGGGSGLTLISTTTVSSGTSVNINSVFSATYDNYLIVANLKAGQDVGNFQLRASTTTTNTGYYYAGQRTQSNNSGPTLFYGANTASINIQEIGTDFGVLTIQVNNPFVADTTAISATAIMNNLTQLKIAYLGGGVNNSTSYDGFTISLDSGGFGSGGKVRVYGYANS